MTALPNSLAARDIASLIHPYTNLDKHRTVGPFVITKGDGCYVIDDGGRRYLEGMRTQVGASEEQLRSVNAILEDTRHKLDELAAKEKPMHDQIRMEHIEQIRALLNDRQRAAYDKWRDERAKQAASQSAQKTK